MANLLDQASILLTPTASDNGKVLCVKPSAAPYGDFDFSRNSSATRVNAQGLVEDVQILSGNLVSNGDFSQEGAELVTNGNFATDTDWTKGSGITISGGSANFTGVANANINQNAGLVTGKTYKIVFTVSNYVSGDIDYNVGGATRQGAISANGTYTDYVVSDSGQVLYFQSDQTLGFVGSIDNVSVKEVGQDWTVTNSDANNYVVFNGSTARLKFLNLSPITVLNATAPYEAGKKYKLTVDVASVTSGGIKFAQSGVNEVYDTAGISTRIINPTSNGNVAFYRTVANVDITLNSVSLIEVTDDTNLPRINYDGFSYDGSGNIIPNSGCGSWLFEPQSTNLYAYSEDFSNAAWIKQGGATVTITSNVAPDGTTNSVYNLTGTNSNLYTGGTTGVEHTISVYAKSNGQGKDNFKLRLGNSTSSSITVTDEWVRYELTATPTSTVFGLTVDSSPNNEWDILIWGAQLEQQSYATSYIPTEGTTVTRNRDLCTGGGSSALINSTEGVLYFEGSTLANDGTNRYLSINDGTVSNYIYFRYVSTSNQVLMRTQVGGVTINTISTFLTDTTLNAKFALKWKSGDYAFWINGVEVGTDSSTTIFTANTLDLIEYSFPTDGGGGFPSKTKCLAVFPYLNDTELAELTTI